MRIELPYEALEMLRETTCVAWIDEEELQLGPSPPQLDVFMLLELLPDDVFGYVTATKETAWLYPCGDESCCSMAVLPNRYDWERVGCYVGANMFILSCSNIEERWDDLIPALHAAGYALPPYPFGSAWGSIPELPQDD